MFSLLSSLNVTDHFVLVILSLHDALPICRGDREHDRLDHPRLWRRHGDRRIGSGDLPHPDRDGRDRKSTRLNSSHVASSYADFCLKKKRKLEKTISNRYKY